MIEIFKTVLKETNTFFVEIAKNEILIPAVLSTTWLPLHSPLNAILEDGRITCIDDESAIHIKETENGLDWSVWAPDFDLDDDTSQNNFDQYQQFLNN